MLLCELRGVEVKVDKSPSSPTLPLLECTDMSSFTSASAVLLQKKRVHQAELQATEVATERSPRSSANVEETASEYFFTLTEAQAAAREEFIFSGVACVGLVHHALEVALSLKDGSDVELQRDHANEVDANAIRVTVPSSDEDDATRWSMSWDEDTGTWSVERAVVCVGMLGWQHARELAPLLDSGKVRVLAAHVDGPASKPPHELALHVTVDSAAGDEVDALRRAPMLNGRKLIEVGGRSEELALSDVAAALEATRLHVGGPSWPPCGVGAGSWQPLPMWPSGGGSQGLGHGLPWGRSPMLQHSAPAELPEAWHEAWPPYDPAQLRALTADEVEQAQHRGWPPPSSLLVALGVGPADDAAWWGRFGLRAPVAWGLSGAIDLIPLGRQSISANVLKAKALLDGGAHAASTPWLDTTLDALDELMHEPTFWCKRKPDSFIRSFGGPYVLGQDEGKLKLIRGAAHSELTQTVCRGHSLLYTAIHLAPPVAPGFNTLIFGLNLRSAGFYYHQDSDVRWAVGRGHDPRTRTPLAAAVPRCSPAADVPENCSRIRPLSLLLQVAGLAAKNAPLKPSQPVVTTVLYDRQTDLLLILSLFASLLIPTF